VVRKATAQEMEILPTSPSAAQPHCSTRAAAPGWKTYSRPRCRVGCRCRRLVRPTCATSCSERRDLTTGGYRPGAGALPARPGGPAPPPLPSTRGGPAELRALLAWREKHIHHGQRKSIPQRGVNGVLDRGIGEGEAVTGQPLRNDIHVSRDLLR
jgi:hypothetical protein